MRIPSDISLVGYDDIIFASLPDIMLTTISNPKYEIGLKAVELLCKAIKDKTSRAKYRAHVASKLVVCETKSVLRK